ncbi:MAG: alpha/beta fold hydrolase [Oscillospiraceae bacterium]|nr:alpha/beta fold hydrolase [Oscillospiraceae bacterium]
MNSEYKNIIKDADTAVLFIHGILGTPRHFDFLLPLVPDGWSAWSILLPGHGGTYLDFANSSMDKWKAYCEKALLELCDSHRRVILLGHSMGTLLSVYLAEKHPDKVSEIFALAMPLCPHLTPVAMAGCIHLIYSSPDRAKGYFLSCHQACSIALTKNLFAYLRWIPRYLELFALARETREIMSTLKAYCVAIQSRHDELVAFRSIKFTGNAETIVLPHSRHYYYSEKDRKTIEDAFLKFIDRLT